MIVPRDYFLKLERALFCISARMLPPENWPAAALRACDMGWDLGFRV
jgi:hypothetical protein